MSSKTVTTTQSEQHHESVLKAFFSGFMMSVSSPLTILFWLGIYGSILAETTSLYDTKELVLASAAIFLGVAIWDVTMAEIASSFRQILNIHLLFLISVISSISLIGFGLYFGFEAFKLLF